LLLRLDNGEVGVVMEVDVDVELRLFSNLIFKMKESRRPQINISLKNSKRKIEMNYIFHEIYLYIYKLKKNDYCLQN
jgi:hypothetical protein